MLSLPPLALYIHLPWCERKCPYCDFNSHAAGVDAPFGEYRARLLADIELELEGVQGRSVESVFVGGGTPSLFPAEEISALFAGLRQRLDLAPQAEITLEANPGSAEAMKFRAFRDAGINRLSIGVQSFDDDCLRELGRVHDAREALAAVEAARAAGFDNFNIDLMHGLPGQTAAMARRDLEVALACDPPHLSWYQLTIEPNTRFHAFPPSLPDEDTLAAIQDAGETLLAERGFVKYEVSAYARAGRRSRHNLNYWNFGDYLGIGAGAHGKLTWPGTGGIQRTQRTRVPRDYLRGMPSAARHTHPVEPEARMLEYLMNALRLTEGTPLAQFHERTGLDTAALERRVQPLRDAGLVSLDSERLRATALGLRHLDDLLARFA